MNAIQSKPPKALDIDLVLAKLLRVGSAVSAGLMAVGLGLSTLGAQGALGDRVLTWGIIVLVATPVMRVAAALLVFLRERDYLFALFCVLVLSSLAVGMVIGKA